MYRLLEDKHKSSSDFRAFLTHMINERNHINAMPEQERADFAYHYSKIPEYFEQYIQKYEHGVLRPIAAIQVAVGDLQKAIK